MSAGHDAAVVAREDPSGDAAGLPRFAAGPVGGAALMAVAILLVVGGGGYHRDELYFLEASKHIAWGYVDQPPLSVGFVWLSHALFGNSLVGLRSFPALADGAMVVGTGLLARELGARRFAQGLAALCLAVSPLLAAGHLAGPTIYDIAGWTFVSWLVVRILRTGDERLWIAIGLVVGVALMNKETILFVVGALVVGLVVNGQSRVLRSPWLLGGAVIALLVWSPNIAWQIQHGWPTVEMSRNLRAEHSGIGYAAPFLVIQLLLPGWWAAPVWIGGLLALWREVRFRDYRSFAVAYSLLFALLIVFIADRPYYIAGLYPVLFAAGSIVAEGVVGGSRRFLSHRAPGRRVIWRSKRAATIWVLVPAVLSIPMTLPVLPAGALALVPLQTVNYNLGEVLGWPELAAAVAGVYRSLPPGQRRLTTIVTANYGEAGAIDRYGPSLGLPRAYSGHNSYWWWGPPVPSLGVTIAIGFDRGELTPFFGQVRLARRFTSPSGIDNDENGAPIWVGSDQLRPWPRIWPLFRHYG